ncbi:MAG: hypothetical protein O2975_00915, partial [Proteobacteria bacterium]|nr:hypothetical protein [Pseudomonadota bacterium]
LTAAQMAFLEQSAKEGITPLEVMLSGMRYHWAMAMKDPETPDLEHLRFAMSVAKDAAPFVHPRLNSIQGGVPDKPMRFTSQLEDDRDAARRILFVLEKAVRRDPSLAPGAQARQSFKPTPS